MWRVSAIIILAVIGAVTPVYGRPYGTFKLQSQSDPVDPGSPDVHANVVVEEPPASGSTPFADAR